MTNRPIKIGSDCGNDPGELLEFIILIMCAKSNVRPIDLTSMRKIAEAKYRIVMTTK